MSGDMFDLKKFYDFYFENFLFASSLYFSLFLSFILALNWVKSRKVLRKARKRPIESKNHSENIYGDSRDMSEGERERERRSKIE